MKKEKKNIYEQIRQEKTQQRKQFALRILQFREFLYSSGACWYTCG